MSSGVVFYNWGLRCVPRLVVAIHSLRRSYGGPVALMIPDDDLHIGAYEDALAFFNVDVLRFGVPPEFKGVQKFTAKLWISKVLPYDSAVIVESDLLFRGPIHGIFEACSGAQFGIAPYHSFSGPPEGTNRFEAGIWKGWEGLKVLRGPNARIYNDGIIYVLRDSPFIQEWEDLARLWKPWAVGEEHTHTVMMCRDPGKVGEGLPYRNLDLRFNTGVRWAHQPQIDAAIGIHYLSERHVRGTGRSNARNIWRSAYKEVLGLPLACRPGLLTWDGALATQLAAYKNIDEFCAEPRTDGP